MHIDRRTFLATASAAALSASSLKAADPSTAQAPASAPPRKGANRGLLLKAVKFGMINEGTTLEHKFQALKDAGFDGAEFHSPAGEDLRQVRKLSKSFDLPIHGVVGQNHWRIRLSDKDPAVRQQAYNDLIQALQVCHEVGGSTVLLVPGKVGDPNNENHQQVWDRSSELVHKALPTAARLGVHIAIENVWNGFLYDPKGNDQQTADLFVQYVDQFKSPWVGAYLDLSNHCKFSKVEQWIRQLGTRVLKVDFKDFDKPAGKFVEIGKGSVDWAAARQALIETGFRGWATAEVGGGNVQRLRQIAQQMDEVLDL